jgi:molybdopterin synthase sulfur carrier subunit
MTLSALFTELERRFPGMKRKVLSSAALTRNLEYLDVEVDELGEIVGGEESGLVLSAGDEVAVVPPVSSG